jgi:hypothetical protein
MRVVLGLQGREPLVGPAADFVFFLPIAFLNLAHERIVVAFNLKEVIIRKVAPLPLKFAFELIPLAFELLAIHRSPFHPIDQG